MAGNFMRGECVAENAGVPTAGRTAVIAANSLESKGNTVTGEEEVLRRFEVSACGCDCWFCDQCSIGKGLRLRNELVPILETFDGLLLVSLTVDPLLFESPQAAYFYMLDRRCVSRTVQDLRRAGYLNSNRYFYVVEWQQHTEQAHFHALLDASYVPHEALLSSWSKHRPSTAGPVEGRRPAFGTVWISVPRFAGGATHASSYVTKYLTKPPRGGFPTWVLELGRDRQIRRYSASRPFWNRPKRLRSTNVSERDIQRLSYTERMAQCGSTVNVCELHETASAETGEIAEQRDWLGKLDVHSDILRRIDDGKNPKRRRRAFSASCVADVVEQLSVLNDREISWVQGFRSCRGVA